MHVMWNLRLMAAMFALSYECVEGLRVQELMTRGRPETDT